MRLLVVLLLVLGLTAAAEPKASLPDIEDEVMCVECRTALNVSSAPVADQERAFIRARIADDGGLVLGIDSQDLSDDALKFLREKRIEFPSLRDRDGEYADALGTNQLPETFLIDREGRIAALRRGPVDQAWLDENLTPLLEERS